MDMKGGKWGLVVDFLLVVLFLLSGIVHEGICCGFCITIVIIVVIVQIQSLGRGCDAGSVTGRSAR